ncbi:hypothetical protein PR202_ga28161 [Eleusine coracana subsp. coracana]|uniref:Protein kinase domain-containing protein n=1 Tax=Eleusine coracana subsp. coracana TaxID=191504 RepID=A0AAV5DHV4_ELECO|nr:hypothetical protein PR202_ga28161 [Eleusine coracana subsp. coracana]
MGDLADLGCCSCFSFLRKPSVPLRQPRESDGMLSKDLLKRQSIEDADGSFYTGDDPDISFYNGDDIDRSFCNGDDPGTSFYERDDNDYHDGSDDAPLRKRSEEIIKARIEKGYICREILVKETKKMFRSEDENGKKMINQYVHLGKIGSGSYGKVVRYLDFFALRFQVLNKPYMMKIRVVRSETAMTDVLREVSIMKLLEHPNIVNLVEVIDDPNIDKFYMVLEYVEGKMVCDNGIEEATARNYMRDIISGLMYLHSHDDDDIIWRSPGTPVFTAPECCQGSAYHGRPSDTWAVGVTLYCMISGHYPFLGDTLQETYDKIMNDSVQIPDNTNPHLADLLQRLLCKDPGDRITLQAVAEHPWVVGDKGPVPEYICRCGFGRRKIDFQEQEQ